MLKSTYKFTILHRFLPSKVRTAITPQQAPVFFKGLSKIWFTEFQIHINHISYFWKNSHILYYTVSDEFHAGLNAGCFFKKAISVIYNWNEFYIIFAILLFSITCEEFCQFISDAPERQTALQHSFTSLYIIPVHDLQLSHCLSFLVSKEYKIIHLQTQIEIKFDSFQQRVQVVKEGHRINML